MGNDQETFKGEKYKFRYPRGNECGCSQKRRRIYPHSALARRYAGARRVPTRSVFQRILLIPLPLQLHDPRGARLEKPRNSGMWRSRGEESLVSGPVELTTATRGAITFYEVRVGIFTPRNLWKWPSAVSTPPSPCYLGCASPCQA